MKVKSFDYSKPLNYCYMSIRSFYKSANEAMGRRCMFPFFSYDSLKFFTWSYSLCK